MKTISHSAKQKRKHLIADFVLIIILIIFDQLTKYLAVLRLKDKPAYKLIDGVLELNYLENKGAAFGMLQNQGVFFVFVAVIVLSVIAYILYKTPNARKYNLMHILLSLIAAGAIGNMIDRIRLDYVVDFIYIILINFPIFNVADMYVSFSTVILVLALLFYYKESDLSFISFNQKKYREL
ncbi:MAG: signal peptidase II [Blautia sp.]|nr:signal peptidase II [Blautia sp.]MCM1200558.1 signal peptidase II [Bacteroides fragilis]